MSATVKIQQRKYPGQRKGRMVDQAALSRVRELLGDLPRRRDLLIEYLHRIQDDEGHLSAVNLTALASEMKISTAEVYEIASFYHHFDLVEEGQTPPPGVTVRVCNSISCALAGSAELTHCLQRTIGNRVRVQPVSCVGRCHEAPVAVVGRNPVPRADPASVEALALAGTTAPTLPDCLVYEEYRAAGGYQLLTQIHSGTLLLEGREEDASTYVLSVLDAAGLRGLGGAGFPAGRKWRILQHQPAPRLLAVNIDEGEPGTFKDRWFLERDPHRFLEGMLIAACSVEIDEIYIYLRDEYAGIREMLTRELEKLQSNPPCPLPLIHLRRGAGAYVCGEESAMIESIEGKRGMPRLRPPYVAEVGLFGRPTLVHNMETLYWIRDLLQRGATWFLDQGRHGRQGFRAFSVSGRIRNPGVHLAPAGITLRELIDEYCGGMAEGHELYAYLPGGASGGILPASLAHLPLDFDTLQPHGCFIGSAAVIVLSTDDSARAAALNAMRFFAHESCGKCTPCRVGCSKAAELMAQPSWDVATLKALAEVMSDTSICGLGQAAPNPMLSVLRFFPEELES